MRAIESVRNSSIDFIWRDFRNLSIDPLLFASYKDYFSTLLAWIKKNEKSLEHSVYWNRLSPVLNIDINEYISKQPEISLNQESKRIFALKPDTIDSLVMGLNDTLWDLIRFRSGKDCPRCEGELNYVLAEVLKTAENKLILECDTCGQAFNIDGTQWKDGKANIHPVNERLIEKYLDVNE